MPMRYKLTIEYDGTPFCGWQRQQTGLSVQGVIEKALSICTREPIEIFCAGRTDAGVHAMGQVAHTDITTPQSPTILRDSVNALVRPYPISVKEIIPVSDDFHARFSATQRAYIYRIKNTAYPPVLDKNRVWWYKYPLNVENMQKAANLLIGKHDFSTFRAAGCQAKSPIKTINSIDIKQENDEIIITTIAPSFLYHQIRNITGALIFVGANKWTLPTFTTIFHSKNRTNSAPTAPAAGLYFYWVKY